MEPQRYIARQAEHVWTEREGENWYVFCVAPPRGAVSDLTSEADARAKAAEMNAAEGRAVVDFDRRVTQAQVERWNPGIEYELDPPGPIRIPPGCEIPPEKD